MRKQKANTYEYVLDNKERELVLNCLRYCRHRYEEHESTGLNKAIGNKGNELCILIKELE